MLLLSLLLFIGKLQLLDWRVKNKHGPHQTPENFLVVKIYLLAHSRSLCMAWHGMAPSTSETDRILRLPCAKDGTQSINMTQSNAELTRLCFSHTRAQTQLSDLSVCFTLVKYLWRRAKQTSMDDRYTYACVYCICFGAWNQVYFFRNWWTRSTVVILAASWKTKVSSSLIHAHTRHHDCMAYWNVTLHSIDPGQAVCKEGAEKSFFRDAKHEDTFFLINQAHSISISLPEKTSS